MRRKERGHAGGESPTRKVKSAGGKPALPNILRDVSPPVPQSLEALRRLSRRQLLALARRQGLRGRSRLKKEELLLALGAALGILSAEPAVPPAPARLDREDLPLPDAYGKDRLVLLPIDPYWVHAYWELSAPRVSDSPRGSGEAGDARYILRVYDVTFIQFDGTNARGFFDIEISRTAGNWYINLWSPGKSLCAEVGLGRPDGSFSPLVRSNVIQTPPTSSSPRTEERWIRVEWRQEADVPRQDHSAVGVPGPRPREPLRAEEYRHFLEGTHRVKILQPDEQPPLGPAGPPVDEAGSHFESGLSSPRLVRLPKRTD
ncbi:MAG TPA: DUF4912 domain-containing protein [Candidatus Methylomirabilis sp.]|nr:DUF4912 domain-containing protein [Candidatus Methylomirabilis sp.]